MAVFYIFLGLSLVFISHDDKSVFVLWFFFKRFNLDFFKFVYSQIIILFARKWVVCIIIENIYSFNSNLYPKLRILMLLD